MSNSQHAADVVRDVIESDPVIRNGLARGLVNVRALARHIQITTRQDVTLEALVAAIRRYPTKEAVVKGRAVSELITKLSLKSEIVVVEIQNGPEIQDLLAKFSQKVDTSRGESLSVASSIKEMVVVIDSTNLGKLTGMIPRKSVLSVTRDLAEISVTMAEPFKNTVGAMAAITNEIAMEGINVIDYIRAAPDLEIIVEARDALRTYRAMERLRSQNQG